MFARCIDVSTAQPVIHWDRVKAAGITAVWIKASEGAALKQRRIDYLRRAYAGAKSVGMDRGAYHVLRSGYDLPYYLDSIRGLDLAWRHVCDLEHSRGDDGKYRVRGRGEGVTLSCLRRWVDAWARELPGSLLYGSRSLLDDCADWGLPLFVATRPWGDEQEPPHDLSTLLRHQPAIPWAAWQLASDMGRVDGIAGAVDLGLYDPVQCRMP